MWEVACLGLLSIAPLLLPTGNMNRGVKASHNDTIQARITRSDAELFTGVDAEQHDKQIKDLQQCSYLWNPPLLFQKIDEVNAPSFVPWES